MSEREIRERLQHFCEDVDGGRLQTNGKRLGLSRLLRGSLLVAATLGAGACSDDTAPDYGHISDYSAYMRDGGPDFTPDLIPDQPGPVADYMAPMPDRKVDVVPDRGGVADYTAPFKG